MIRNILKISLRYLLKQKAYAFINIFGLAIGLTTCILIFLFIQDELSYDRFHEDANLIIRVEPRWVGMGEDSHWASTHGGVLPAISSRFPEVRHAVKLHFNYQPSIVEYENVSFSEEGIIFADSSFFRVFPFRLLEGDPEDALKGTARLVISKEYARKYFGEEDPLNKIIRVDDRPYKVSGVMEDIPANSHFHFNIAIAMDDMRSYWEGVDRPGPSTFYSYLKVDSREALDTLVKKANMQVWEIHGYDVEYDSTGVMQDYEPSLIFQPITDIHLNGHAEKEIEANSDKKYIYIFASIALFVLIIASINYMNLATARSSRRSREVGLRKVMGAQRTHVFSQFIAESYLVSLIAMVLAIIITEFILPGFNQLTGKELTMNIVKNPSLGISLFLVVLVVGFIAGSYPSLFLARMSPLKVLRVRISAGRSNQHALLLRRILVVSQFTISVILIIGTITIFRQLSYIQNKTLGFEKEHLLVIPIPSRSYMDRVASFKDQLAGNPDVISASMISGVPGQRMPFLTVALPDATESSAEDAQSFSEGFGMRVLSGDADMLKTLGVQFIEGRDFDKEIQLDEQEAFIINQAAADWLELKDPLNTKFTYLYNMDPPKEGKIIGVTEDFHYASLHSEVEPLMMHVYPHYNRYLGVRLQANRIKEGVAAIEQQWTEDLPSVPFSNFFLDPYYDNLYKAESNMGLIVSYFSVLAIIIACLGLFGLVSFITEQRTKEIGIRKILGASTASIIRSISTEFVMLVLISNVLAWIPVYLIMKNWLDDFAYRTSLSIWVFALALLASFVIAMVTISFQSFRAATAKPINAIKYE